jgi:hypothetical protein
MLAYVKDFVRDEWNSKQAILSMGIAGHLGGHYYSVPGPWRVVTHLADGRDFTPRGVSPGMCVAIVHDSMEYPGLKRMPVRIGLGDIPGCTENLASFPLAAGDMVRRPVSERYDAVIGGRVDGTLDDIGDIVDRAGLVGKRVAIAVAASPDAVGQISAQLGARLNGVDVIDNPDLPVMTALYSTCPTVVHLGHCARDYLHAYAMYHTEVEGRKLVERVPGERYTPSRIEELVRLLAQWK